MAVHHIDMDTFGTSGLRGFDLLAEAGEVGGEDGGGEVDRTFLRYAVTRVFSLSYYSTLPFAADIGGSGCLSSCRA